MTCLVTIDHIGYSGTGYSNTNSVTPVTVTQVKAFPPLSERAIEQNRQFLSKVMMVIN